MIRTDVNDRLDRIAEELGESHGWLEQADTDSVRYAFVRRHATWRVTSLDGYSLLTVEGSNDGPAYPIPFSPEVPWFVVVHTCAEAAADCPRCGTGCESDCAVPDVTVGGEIT